jgi:hypothetical protein
MSLQGPAPLGAQHRLEGFDCGKPALNDWLLRHARQAQGSGSARTFVVADADRVVGYFSLTVGQIDTLEAPERIRKGMGQYPVPVVILARLAVSTQDKGRGIGFGLLQDAIRRTMLIAEQAAIRAMLTHPSMRKLRGFTRASASLPRRCASSNCCCSSRMHVAGSSRSAGHASNPVSSSRRPSRSVGSGTDTALAVDPIRLCREAARLREVTRATAALSSSDSHAVAQCTVHTMHGSNDRTTC